MGEAAACVKQTYKRRVRVASRTAPFAACLVRALDAQVTN
ncbi:hypothetical protein COLO4_12556 [Corchorus olitorius]|uniref:Uncharacterized protein n=1 Tax=Corchorus olitorius TaxID=93759 RepID=A0A1R3K0H1_9ROSI|nr:hypothetical protein COLO4_12556 [Corchorus olitorius]